MLRQRVLAVAIVLFALVGFFFVLTQGQDSATGQVPDTLIVKKVFVCKYVGTPGEDERLQTGQNPISVSVNAIPDPPGPDVQPGDEFADAQGRSLVIAFDTGQHPEPECPIPENPTTTTTHPAETTTTHATTTTTEAPCPEEAGAENHPPTTAPPTTCPPGTTTTTTLPSSTTTTTTTEAPPTTGPPVTVTFPPETTLPETFSFAGASTVCRAEVPTIVITFGNAFPELAGETGILTVTSIADPSVFSSQPLVYQPGTTVEFLYPGTEVFPDGTIADVPGWILQPNGLWVVDPSDAFLREGLLLTYTLNPTAEAIITYPPESANCANPDNLPPGAAPPGFVIPPAR